MRIAAVDGGVGGGNDASSSCVLVGGVMRPEAVYTVTEDEPVAEIVRIMVQHHVRRTPVVRDGKLVGIVSRGDLMRALVHPSFEACE